MRIGELAKRAATTTRTLRYYESRGLLLAQRDGSGYRVYDENDLRMLRQIRRLQDLGFDLEEIRPFVDCLRAGHSTVDECPASFAVYLSKLGEIDDCIAQLEHVRTWIHNQMVQNRLDSVEELESPPAPRCLFSGGESGREMFPAPAGAGRIDIASAMDGPVAPGRPPRQVRR
ncbi:MerR family transcriptional regulator [Nocardia sp. NPDC051570]|uniref:MerR family transcriptional regulator n=1 Tax=Nocardia sp. NPDC051570 TaxID=3364324 RepID=UPI0037A5C826